MAVTPLGEAWVNIGANTAPLTAGLQGAKAQVQASTAQMQAQLKTIGTTMALVGTAATAAFALTVKSAIKFEKELAQVSTMLDESAMSIMPKYKKELLAMSAAFGEGTDTLSKGLYDILSASIAPEKALGVLAEAAKAATAGITDTGVAADAITTILNSYGMSAEQAGDVSDKLFAIVKRGKTTFAELAPAIGKVAATAAKTGLSFVELGASIATITRAGIRTDEAMTAVNGVMIAFLKPTDEAKEAAKKFGVALETNTLRTEGLIGVMNKLKDATAEQLAQMFPNIRGLKGIISAMGDLEGYTEDYNLMLDSAGLTQGAFAKQSATLGFKIEQLKKSFGVIAVTIGDKLIPVVQNIVVFIGKVVNDVINWIEENPKLTATLVKLAAALSVFTVAGGLLILADLYFKKLALTIMTTVIPAVTKLGVSLIALSSNPIFIVIAAIAGLATAWETNLFGMKDITEKVIASIKGNFVDLTDTLGGGGGGAGAYFGEIAEETRKADWKAYNEGLAELIRLAEDGKISASELYKAMHDLAKETGVLTEKTTELEPTVGTITTNIKDLEQAISLSTKEYEASGKSLSETIDYYKELIDKLNQIDVILQTELTLLQQGTEEWYAKKEAIADNMKLLREAEESLKGIIEPLEGLELISAKMALLGDSTEDTEAKIELLKDQAVLLQIELEKAIPETKAWYELKIALKENEDAANGLKEKLKELTEAEKEALVHKEKLANAYKTITDQIYELTHTPMENAIRKLNEQKQAYIDLGVEIGLVNTWYDEQVRKLNEELSPALDDTTKKMQEAGEVAQQTGILGGNAWDNLTISIKKATVTLSNFTAEGVAAAIASIKMHFKPLIDSLINDVNNLTGIFKQIAQANLDRIKQTMYEQIAIIKYGYEEYKKILASMTGGGGGVLWPSYQFGTPYVPKTGLYQLHKGEAVIPANQNTYHSTFSPTVNLTVQGGGSPQSIAYEVRKVLDDNVRQFRRSGFELIPGKE